MQIGKYMYKDKNSFVNKLHCICTPWNGQYDLVNALPTNSHYEYTKVHVIYNVDLRFCQMFGSNER